MNDAVLTDAEFDQRARQVLNAIESQIDQWLDADVVDIDAHRSGGLLELSMPGGSKLVINTQPPLKELWLAARAGGFHFRFRAGQWVDTRDGSEFFASLSHHLTLQAGVPLVLRPVAA